MNYKDLPNDVASERAIFSIILNTPERFVEVVDLLKPADFFSTAHQNIWGAITKLFHAGQDFDIVSIRGQLQKESIDIVPTLSALSESYEEEVNDSNLELFVNNVKNKSLLRKIIRASTSHAQTAQLEATQAKDLIETIEKDVLGILENTAEAKPVDSEGIIEELRSDIAKNTKTGWKGFSTDFGRLDLVTGGLIPTQCWIIGAYTGVGKTFFILQLLLNVLRQGGKVVLFSTEMDRKMNMLRLIGNIAGLGTIRMMRGDLEVLEHDMMRKAEEELASYKDQLTIYDNVFTVADIRLKTKKLKLTKGVDIVAVDFIQNLRGGESIYERMSEAAISLQQMAQELQVCLLIGSQVSQAAAGWQSKEAIEFKGAGEIAAISDVAIWIRKSDGEPDGRTIIIRKVRHGAPGRFDARLTFPSGRIIDMEGSSDVKGQL